MGYVILKFRKAFRIIKYAVSLKSTGKRFQELDEEAQCDYVIANYVFILILFCSLGIVLYVQAVFDRKAFEDVRIAMGRSIILLQTLAIIMSAVGQFGHPSHRVDNWDEKSQAGLLATKIAYFLQFSAIPTSLYILWGVFS